MNMSSRQQNNYDLRIELTPEQIAQANEHFYSIAQNLQRIKQDTQDTEIHELVDREDHQVFKSMMYACGLGDIDEWAAPREEDGA